jgi:hypothetical protein
MEPLKQTVVPPSVLPTSRAGVQLGTWLRQRDFMLRALVFLTSASLVLSFALCAILVLLLQERTQFVGFDNDGTVIIARSKSFAEAKELHTEMALIATSVLLSRGPKGFNLAEFLPRLFSRPTLALAEQSRRDEQSDFEQRQVHQMPEVAQIEAQDIQPGWVELTVTGQLIRMGLAGGQPTLEAIPFSLRLTLTKNTNLLRAGRYPVVVNAFTLNYEPPRP